MDRRVTFQDVYVKLASYRSEGFAAWFLSYIDLRKSTSLSQELPLLAVKENASLRFPQSSFDLYFVLIEATAEATSRMWQEEHVSAGFSYLEICY